MQAAATTKGRPRKPFAERYPSGKVKPEVKQPNGSPPAKIRRAVDLALSGAADPLLATPIGWLRLHGVITDTQAAAAVQYGKLRSRADADNGLPRRCAASPSYQMGRAHESVPEVELGEDGRPKKTREMKRYDDLRARLARAGDILDEVVVEGKTALGFQLPTLIWGLDVCSRFFGLTK